MEKLNEKKLNVLIGSTETLNRYVADLCSIRPDIFSINLEEWSKQVENVKKQIGAKQILLFVGPFSSGKSSFINALLGEDILPTSNRPCTSVVTELTFVNGGGHRGQAVRKDNQRTDVEYNYSELLKMVDGPTGAIGESAAYHHIELFFDITQLPHDSACLRQLCDAEVTIVDCPGYGSPYYSNEDVIEEYISKASHTFWINPVDRMGGISDYKKLSEIRKKTTTLIPVMSNADLIESESQREEITESYAETIGSLFRSRDPIFCSAIKFRRGKELEKEIKKQKPVGEQLKAKESEMNLLFEESGLSNVFAAVIDSASEKSVTDAKVKSVYHDLDELMGQVSLAASRECSYWKKELKNQGWDDERNQQLERNRSEVEIWIDGQAERVGRLLDSEIKECVQNYVDSCRGKVNRRELLELVVDVWKNRFDACAGEWGKYLVKTYRSKDGIEITENKHIELPQWLNESELVSKLCDTRDVIFNTIQDSGVKTITEGGLGTALLCSTGAIKGLAVVGGTLSTCVGVVGIALVAVAAVGFIPVYSRHAKHKKDEQRRELEKKIDKWLAGLDMRGLVSNVLRHHNEELYNSLEKSQQKVADDLIEKKNRCEAVMRGIDTLRNVLQVQFVSSQLQNKWN